MRGWTRLVDSSVSQNSAPWGGGVAINGHARRWLAGDFSADNREFELLLGEVATIDMVEGPAQISRENGKRRLVVEMNVVGRDIGGFVAEARRRIADEVSLPTGYFVTWGGQFRLQQEANRRLAVVVPVTLLAVFLLLFSSFQSVRNALLILLNIPLALVGGIAGLWLSGQNLSVPASLGFIALFGFSFLAAIAWDVRAFSPPPVMITTRTSRAFST